MHSTSAFDSRRFPLDADNGIGCAEVWRQTRSDVGAGKELANHSRSSQRSNPKAGCKAAREQSLCRSSFSSLQRKSRMAERGHASEADLYGRGSFCNLRKRADLRG